MIEVILCDFLGEVIKYDSAFAWLTLAGSRNFGSLSYHNVKTTYTDHIEKERERESKIPISSNPQIFVSSSLRHQIIAAKPLSYSNW